MDMWIEPGTIWSWDSFSWKQYQSCKIIVTSAWPITLDTLNSSCPLPFSFHEEIGYLVTSSHLLPCLLCVTHEWRPLSSMIQQLEWISYWMTGLWFWKQFPTLVSIVKIFQDDSEYIAILKAGPCPLEIVFLFQVMDCANRFRCFGGLRMTVMPKWSHINAVMCTI